MDFRHEFGCNLREGRIAAGLLQKDLAQRVGVTDSCISMYESGERLPNLKMTSVLSQVLCMSLDDLVPLATHEMPVNASQTDIYDLIGEDDV